MFRKINNNKMCIMSNKNNFFFFFNNTKKKHFNLLSTFIYILIKIILDFFIFIYCFSNLYMCICI